MRSNLFVQAHNYPALCWSEGNIEDLDLELQHKTLAYVVQGYCTGNGDQPGHSVAEASFLVRSSVCVGPVSQMLCLHPIQVVIYKSCTCCWNTCRLRWWCCLDNIDLPHCSCQCCHHILGVVCWFNLQQWHRYLDAIKQKSGLQACQSIAKTTHKGSW